IIHLHDCEFADPDEKCPYLVMDYSPGLSLDKHVQRHGCLKPKDLVPLARQIAQAMRAAHDQGVLHRDLKPANILVLRDPDGSWHIKLIDFGLGLKIGAGASTA